jgi:hypothetical protein
MLLRGANRFEDVLPDVVKSIKAAGATLVRIEGVMSVGKTLLADVLGDELCATVVRQDWFKPIRVT